MRLMKSKKGVTLLELMITIGIVAVLSVILFRTFGSISEIAFRVEQHRNVSNELISLSQIIQNYADKNTIDYDEYKIDNIKQQAGDEFKTSDEKSEDGLLLRNKGISNILYLSGQDGKLKFYSSGDCIDMGVTPQTGLMDMECALYLNKGGETIQLTNPKKIYLSNIMFKIIPFASEEDYISGEGGGSIIQSLNKPGFWMLAQAYNTRYNKALWANSISIHLQQFFNLK